MVVKTGLAPSSAEQTQGDNKLEQSGGQGAKGC